MSDVPLIQLTDIYKTYHTGKIHFEALKQVNLTIHAGEYIAILGPSGSGKSTLMQIIGCLSTPTSGSYRLNGQEVSGLKKNELAKVRGKTIGFVFQSFNLLPQYDIIDNTCLPLVYQQVSPNKRHQLAKDVLVKLGLGDHFKHKPNELSGGQKQRVAIARALITNPDIILADEPTGNLDTKSGSDVIEWLERLHDEGRTVIIVTHDMSIAKRAKRILHIKDGFVGEE